MSSSDETDNLRSLGAHRVIEPEGALPQPAWKLDNSPVTLPTETLVYVHTLHIDSASFTQIANACEQDSERMREHILDIAARRGKMHNPTTDSGGVLLGTIEQLDEVFAAKHNLARRTLPCVAGAIAPGSFRFWRVGGRRWDKGFLPLRRPAAIGYKRTQMG